MKPLLKQILIRNAIAVVVWAMLQTGCASNTDTASSKNEHLDLYDRSSGFLWLQKWPPWIPGTEGQKEVNVQVLDATTMQPIEGAIVVGGYYGQANSMAGGGMVCARSESAVSDAQGWATLPNDQDPRVGDGSFSALRGPWLESAYKRGYQMATTIYIAEAGGHNEWYVMNYKPAPINTPGRQLERISARKFSNDHKSALLETKERSRIYLMPSTAKTKEERWREITQMGDSSCGRKFPFKFSKSEGGLAARKAMYQEMLDISYPENIMRAQRESVESYEENYRLFRQGFYKE